MGRLATKIAAAVTDADNLPSSQKLPRVSFIDALLPRSYINLGSPRKEQEPLDRSPSQKSYVTYYDIKKDKHGRKSIIAHKSPLGSAVNCGGKPANEGKKDKQGGGKKQDDNENGHQKDNQQGKKGGKNKQENNGGKKDDNKNDQKKGEGGNKNPQNREWTAEEHAKLKELWAANTPLKQIAKELKRPQKQCEERYNEISGGGGDDTANDEKQADAGGRSKMTKAQKKAAKKAANGAGAADGKGGTKKDAKKASSKAQSVRSNGEARFTMGEWLTLQEDDLFSFGELQCLSEIIMKDQKQTWVRIAAKFYDLTGRRVHPDDIREKFEGMAGMY
ncbi:hypothetical protein LTR78_007553 [Recurvomyces mirabilis]|uniref:Myb-like domain-containing protein n=1 Tax=Recurvomyces mirabilis TaxID=574656 RepID=A0AAE0TRJ8_9PEZI|nr:hypothetical protein LTR78_007553 [Recurvomyces mirabilis]KAK5159935.1 hypothetical protein LTS14_002041 [Recurvomyces mirabilis]